MWHGLWKKVSREALVGALFFLPESRRIRLERYLRGREQFGELARADVAVVSFGKSGRTWLRVMLWRFYERRLGLGANSFAGFGSFGGHKDVPRLFFTHDNYLKDYTGNRDTKRDYYDKKVVLLVRDPRDTAASQYFQWKFRMRRAKKALNAYPEHGSEVSVHGFLMHEGAGLPKVIGFLNDWARERGKFDDLLVVRYEDLKRDTPREVGRVLRFIGEAPTQDELRDCVAYASVDNMRALETKRVFWLSGSRMKAGDAKNPDSFKVRRAKVGGWRDYMSEAEAAQVDALVEERLLPGFGYREDERPGVKIPA